LNACLGEKLAIVSPLPQTTRDELLGVVNFGATQIAFTDTPGLHRPRTELGRRMNARALDAVRNHDVVVFMTDVLKIVEQSQRKKRQADKPRANTSQIPRDVIHADDRRLLQVLPKDVPCLLVLNKADLLKDKRHLLPLMTAFGDAHPFAAIVPASVLSADGVQGILQEIAQLLPEAAAAFGPDQVTDRPVSFFVREYVREQVLLQTRSEVPHSVAVTVDRFEEGKNNTSISATIHVEKPGQKAILVGQHGAQIKAIGTEARKQLEELIGRKIYLELFVRVTERWKDMTRQLSELGYDGASARDLKSVLPEIKVRPHKTRPSAKPKPAARLAAPVRRAKPKPSLPKGSVRHIAPPKSKTAAASKSAKPNSAKPNSAKPNSAKPNSAKPKGSVPTSGASRTSKPASTERRVRKGKK
jgi:GTP-binding protein Era